MFEEVLRSRLVLEDIFRLHLFGKKLDGVEEVRRSAVKARSVQLRLEKECGVAAGSQGVEIRRSVFTMNRVPVMNQKLMLRIQQVQTPTGVMAGTCADFAGPGAADTKSRILNEAALEG